MVNEKMRAVICTKYGSPEVLQIQEMEKPIPKDNEVLIKVRATTVTLYDVWMRTSTAPPGFGFLMRLTSGIRKPKQPIFGTEFAGEVKVVGKDVKLFKAGDQVFAFTGMNLGAYVEFICMPEDGMLAIKPTNMTYDEATAVPYGALTALFFLRKGNIQKGQKVLIFGASGGVGTFAVQIAKKIYECEVTGVCSTAKIDLVKSLGADHIIDYTKEDFTKNGEIYDVIFDTVGKSSVRRSKRSLKKKGSYVFTTYGVPKLLAILWLKMTSSITLGSLGVVEERPENLIFLKELIETGKINSVIDKRFSFEQIAEAHAYVESGQKKGQVVITVEER